MTAEWFDLGMRLHAAHTGHPAPRLTHSPIHPATRPVALRAHQHRGQTTATLSVPGQRPDTATGLDVLRMLDHHGISLTQPTPATLITDDPTTLHTLDLLARTIDPDSPHAPIAAHIGWWNERADYPGGAAVTLTTDACRTRWMLGTDPTLDTDPATWRTWLHITDDTTTGILDLYRHLTDTTPLPGLDVLADDDHHAYTWAQTSHDAGHDWRRSDTLSRAAVGLRARCDAADLYAAALLNDTHHRLRAVHTGTIVTGTLTHLPTTAARRIELTSPRLDARLRPGNEITGWIGTPTDTTPRFRATLITTHVTGTHLVLTLTGTTHLPSTATTGDPITLMPTPPTASRQRAGRKNLRALYATRRTWLTTGHTPTPTRRPVPLDVLVAGAEPE